MEIIQQYWASSEKWEATNPVLKSGEVGFDLDTSTVKFGDGVTPYLNLTSKKLKMDPL